jgi:hypothetical protein
MAVGVIAGDSPPRYAVVIPAEPGLRRLYQRQRHSLLVACCTVAALACVVYTVRAFLLTGES